MIFQNRFSFFLVFVAASLRSPNQTTDWLWVRDFPRISQLFTLIFSADASDDDDRRDAVNFVNSGSKRETERDGEREVTKETPATDSVRVHAGWFPEDEENICFPSTNPLRTQNQESHGTVMQQGFSYIFISLVVVNMPRLFFPNWFSLFSVVSGSVDGSFPRLYVFRGMFSMVIITYDVGCECNFCFNIPREHRFLCEPVRPTKHWRV